MPRQHRWVCLRGRSPRSDLAQSDNLPGGRSATSRGLFRCAATAAARVRRRTASARHAPASGSTRILVAQATAGLSPSDFVALLAAGAPPLPGSHRFSPGRGAGGVFIFLP